jgi:hypothetical protein
MSARSIQSDQEIIGALTELLNVINNPTTNITAKKNDITIMNALLTRLSDTEQSSAVTSFALGIVTNSIDNLRRQNKNIPQHLETKRVKLSRNLIQSTQREAAAAAAAAATNAARCTGRGCFSRFTRSIKRKIGLHTTPTPPTSPIVSPDIAAPQFRRTSRQSGQSGRSRTTPPLPSLPGAVEDYSNRMPLGGSRRVRRRTKHEQRVKHRRRTTTRRLF